MKLVMPNVKKTKRLVNTLFYYAPKSDLSAMTYNLKVTDEVTIDGSPALEKLILMTLKQIGVQLKKKN